MSWKDVLASWIATQPDDAPAEPPPADPPPATPPPDAPAGMTPEMQAAVDAAVAAAVAALQTPPADSPPATPPASATPPAPARQSGGPPANPPTNAKSVLQRLIDGETVSDDEIDKAWDDGTITTQMNDRAGARTEVRI